MNYVRRFILKQTDQEIEEIEEEVRQEAEEMAAMMPQQPGLQGDMTQGPNPVLPGTGQQ
jgi:hypothetical protein